MFDIDDAQERLRQIRAMIRDHDDNEEAHALEAALFVDTLKAIASGMDRDAAAEMAAEALKSRDIEFTRWFA